MMRKVPRKIMNYLLVSVQQVMVATSQNCWCDIDYVDECIVFHSAMFSPTFLKPLSSQKFYLLSTGVLNRMNMVLLFPVKKYGYSLLMNDCYFACFRTWTSSFPSCMAWSHCRLYENWPSGTCVNLSALTIMMPTTSSTGK